MNKPTTNFYFDNEIDFWFFDKEIFYETMFEIEQYVKEERYSDVPNKIRKIYEKIIANIINIKNIVCEKNYYNNNREPSLKNKISGIANSLSLEREVSSSMMSILFACNKWSHGDNKIIDKISSFEVLTILKNFYVFIIAILQCETKNVALLQEKVFSNLYCKSEPLKIISSYEEEIYKNKSPQFVPDISANEISLLNFIFKDKRTFMIPIYQRGYSWTEENVEDLFSDIVSRMKDNTSHYFGVIAGKYNEDKEINFNKVRVVKIIDGQQRLTTSLLVVMASYYILKELKYSNLENSFKELFQCLGNQEDFSNLFYNPGGNGKDNDSFKRILNLRWESHQKSSNYEKNLYFLISKIKEKFGLDPIAIEEFRDYFLSKFTIAVVDFNKDSIDIKKELEIFENLNSKGKSLTLSDLIKNFIFNLCHPHTLEKESKKIESYFELKIVAEIRRYTKEEDKLKINEHLNSFYTYITNYFKGQEIKASPNSNNALKDFRDNVIYGISGIMSSLKIDIDNKQFLSFDQYKSVIDALHNYLLKGFIPIKFQNFSSEFYAKDLISSLSDAKKTPIYALSFLLSENYDNFDNLNKKEKILFFKCYSHLIQVMTLHFLVVGQGDSEFKRKVFESSKNIKDKINSYNKNNLYSIFEMLEKEINFQNFIFKNHPISKEKLSNEIVEINSKSWVSKILLLLISYKISDLTSDPNLFNGKISLEHILPQNITSTWLSNLREWNSIDINNMSDKLLEEKCEKYINQIGNYLLVPKDLNSKLQDKQFAAKKEILNKQNFIFNLTQNIDKNIDILSKTKWSFEDIENRSNALKLVALSIFNIN